MKTRLLFLSVLLFAGVFYSTSTYSQNCVKEKKACIMEDLSPEQQKKVETIKINSDKKIIQYKADLKIKKAELEKLRIAESPSLKDINLKIDEIYLIKSDIKKEEVGTELQIRNELTPEQREKFDMHRAMKGKDMHKMNNCDKKPCDPKACHGSEQNIESQPGPMQHNCQHQNQQK